MRGISLVVVVSRDKLYEFIADNDNYNHQMYY